MADGGSPPLGDPGGLHVYNMNGSSHKMAELVLGEPPGSLSSSLNCQDRPNIDHYGDGVIFPSGSNMQQTSHAQSYLSMEPISYTEPGVYEELKRPSQPLQSLPYFNSIDSSVMYDSFKTEAPANNMPGYIDMLSNSETIMNIKREKPEYTEMTISNNSNSSDIPFSSNACASDWNFYNPLSGNGHFSNHASAPASYGYLAPQNQSYASNMMFNNTQSVEPSFQSNDDIHFQSQKITQSILSSEWGAETLYKSHLYSNLAIDSNNRKRRSDGEKSKVSKSKRKKSSSDLGAHSKTVASILLSENSKTTLKSGASSSSTDSVLDSTARNTLVSCLMDNIRSTVQFESFCLSFPRSDFKETGFRQKVSATVNLVQNIAAVEIKSDPFPQAFIMGAHKVITNFRNALKNTTNSFSSASDTEIDNINLSMEQVEEHLPHSMVWVVQLRNSLLTANWEGQIVAGINPVQNLLSISVFQFQPSFSTEGINCLRQTKLTKELADDIKQNMEQFEVSRQLRCDINLNSVAQLYLYKVHGDTEEGCLILELTENPQFYQRWLHTSAEDKNKWRKRKNFFTQADVGEMEVVCIGGLVSELNELVAFILASDPGFEGLYETGINVPFSYDPKGGLHKNHVMNKHQNKSQDNDIESHANSVDQKKLSRNKKAVRKLGSNANKLRKEILEVLRHHNILEQDSFEKILANASVKGDKENNSVDVCLGISLDQTCSCFQDYVNYSCDSATELNTILEMELQPRAFGYYEKDFDLTKVPDENIDKLKVGQLISCKCSEVVYYSFCKREVGQLGYDTHCSKCHVCRTVKFWHCESCDQCTESRSVCVYCGHLRNDQTRCVIKPLSVFKSEVSSAQLVSLDDIKQEWTLSIQQPDDDVLNMPPPNMDTSSAEFVEYNSKNAMVDQLGLLNPVGFLLGQPSVGASRKFRRYKGGQLNDIVPQVKKGGQSTGSGCSIQ